MYKVRKDSSKPIFIFFITVILSGCATAYRPADIFTSDQTTAIEETACPDCSNWNVFTRIQRVMFEEPIEQINPYQFEKGGKNFYTLATTTTTDCNRNKDGDKSPTGKLGTAEIARNELIGTTIMLADSSISKHLASIKATETNMNLLLGAATAGLTGGATVASEAGAKALSAAATGTNASRGMFNETTYRNALSETLIGSVETDRELKREKILGRLANECIANYPVSVALADVQNYLNGGSFYHGLALIREAAELANTKRRKQDILLEDPLAKAMYNNLLLKSQIEAAINQNALDNLKSAGSQK